MYGSGFPSPMRDLLDFLAEFWKNLTARITGGALAIFLTVWAFFERKTPPSYVLFGSLAVYVFVSAFLAWRKERKLVLSLSAASPSDIQKREHIKSVYAELNEQERGVIREIATKGSCQWFIRPNALRANDPWSHLENRGLIEKGTNGRCLLHPSVASELRAIVDGEMNTNA